VHSHQGHVHVSSAVNQGTTFEIYLPCAPAKSRPDPAQSSRSSRPPQAQARILLIEDEDLLRRTSTRLLESFGYTVVSARNGKEGLEVYEREKDTLDLILLDLMMPIMDGEQTYHALIASGIEIPILLTTGHAEENRARALLQAGARLLRKPHDARTLRRTVASALGE
jgi:CheY-like chemotaxis protein